MTVINYVKGIITIHTTNDANSPHIDYNDIQNLTIQETENYGATGSVQLINDLSDTAHNLLSASCNLWSDGTARKLNRAMFLRIYHTSRTSNNAIGVFLITQITASDNLITLTFCDSVQYLRSVGADYVRNHFETSATWNIVNARWNGSHGVLEHDSSITIHGGEHHDIIMGKMYRVQYTNEDETISFALQPTIDMISFNKTMDRTVGHLHRIIIPNIYVSTLGTITGKMYINSGPYSLINRDFTLENGSNTLTFSFPPQDVNYNELNILLVFYEYLIPMASTIRLKSQTGVSGATVRVGKYGGDTRHTYTDHAWVSDIIFSYDTDNVTGTDASGVFTIDQLDGEAPTQESIDLVNYWGRAKALYVRPDAQIAAGTIFQHILQAYDFTCDSMQNTRYVYTFRCNGDVIHNYLLALADMPNGTTQFAFRASKTVWNHIDTGKRYKNTDTSQKTIKYSKDTGSGTDFLSFNPSISLKNNPRLAVAKGTDENDKPIVVALIDPNVPIGAMSTSVNASITTEVEGALACYSNIMTNRSEDWQGEIALSGIDLAYFKTGEYVGGVPITINDSRYGFVNYRAKVKEVKWDFANQKTTITINNYSEVYSNAILDTSKMAYSAGDMSAEASNDDMFVRQFVNIDATGMTSDGSTSDCYFYVDSGTSGHVTDAYTIDLPELNIRVVNAYFPPGNGQASTQYGVNSVKIGNRTHTIHTARRPDKQVNQSLIVNVIYRLT